MTHIALLWKARTIEKYRLKYEREKLNSIRLMKGQTPDEKPRGFFQRIFNYNVNTRRNISESRYQRSTLRNFFLYMTTDQTFRNLLLKSIIGFVVGIIMTYLCFMFFVFQLSISLIHATIMSSIIGVLLTLGLAFSYRIRCLVFLLIPQFFSRMGRYTLTCYALVLILTGPATNTLKNLEMLSESLDCAQEQVKKIMYEMNDSSRKPLNILKRSVETMISSVEELSDKIKLIVTRLGRLTTSVAHSVKSSFDGLYYLIEKCNKKIGTAYEYCSKLIKRVFLECNAFYGPLQSSFCDLRMISQIVCSPVQKLEGSFFIHFSSNFNEHILDVVSKKLDRFTRRVNSMIYLDVQVHHCYSFRSNRSRSSSQVPSGIVTEIRNQADMMLTWLSWSSCVTSLSLLLIISRAKYYQHMYETRSRFDNRYITKELIDLDLKRLRQGKMTVLPLNRREKRKYVKNTSFRLIASENVNIGRSAVAMVITTFKLMIHMVADYSLYWVLMKIRHHGLNQTPLPPGDPDVGIDITGSSFVSNVFKELIGVVILPARKPSPSTTKCLPNPHPPDFQRYLHIGILIMLLWFFAMFEPYGLRLRHVIMGLYRPERAKARALWLCNHIQRTRGSFIKFARRKLHREFKYFSEKNYTFHHWLQKYIPCSCLKYLLGIYPDEPYCLLCGVLQDCGALDDSLVRCDTPECPGTYCTECFSEIGQLCTICLAPADYGDMSDISLEKGSSEEDDDDDDDESYSPNRYEQSSSMYQMSMQQDDDATSKNLPKNSRRWKFSSKKENNNHEERKPLLDLMDKDDGINKINGRTMKKAIMIRHKKYTELDLADERRKALLSFEQDSFCGFHCKICNMNQPIYCSKLNRHKAISTNENKKDLDKSQSFTRINSSIENSVKRIKLRFQNMRKNAMRRRHLRLSNSPSYLQRNIQISLPKRISRNREKFFQNSSNVNRKTARLKHRTKTSTISSFLTPICIPRNTITYNPEPGRKIRLKRSKSSLLADRIIKFVQNVRNTNSCGVQCEKVSRASSISDLKESFTEQYKYDFINIAKKDVAELTKVCFKQAEPDSNEHSHETKRINNKKPTKYIEHKKTRNSIKTLFKNCTNFFRNGNNFSSEVKTVNYFRSGHVPPISHEKTNHKKRKKYLIVPMTSSRNVTKDNDGTRHYRISHYFAEQDLKNTVCGKCKGDFNQEVTDQRDFAKIKMCEGGGKGYIINTNNLYTEVLKQRKPKINHKCTETTQENPIETAEVYRARKKLSKIYASKISVKANKTKTVKNKNTKNNNIFAEIFKTQHKVQTKDKNDKICSSKNHTKKINSKPQAQLPEPHTEHILGQQKHKKRVRISRKQPGKQTFEEHNKKLKMKTQEDHRKKSKTLRETHKKSSEVKKVKRKRSSVLVFPTYVSKNKTTNVVNTKENIPQEKSSLVISRYGMEMPRSMDYYHSLGHRDFDLIAENEEEEYNAIKLRRMCEKQIEAKPLAKDSTVQTGNSKEPESLLDRKRTWTESKKRVKQSTENKEQKLKTVFETNSDYFKNKTKVAMSTSREYKKRRKEMPSNVYCSLNDLKEECHKREKSSKRSWNPFRFLMRCVICRSRSVEKETNVINLSFDEYTDTSVQVYPEIQNVSTQVAVECRNASTWHKYRRKKKTLVQASTIHFNALKRYVNKYTNADKNETKETGVQCLPAKAEIVTKNRYPEKDNRIYKPDYKTNKTQEIYTSFSSSQGDESVEEETSSNTTSVYSTITTEPPKLEMEKDKKYKVTTISNTATSTETAKLCNVSTVTEITGDWWSPILERKNKIMSMKRPQLQEDKHRKNVSVETTGRIVSFQSSADVIPSLHTQLNLMSPDRYFLESRKYDNELLSNYEDLLTGMLAKM